MNKLTLKYEYESDSRTYRQAVTLEQGDCGAGFAALFVEYAKLSGRTPAPEQEHLLAQMMTDILLGHGRR